jgi:hypothetical protein
MRVVGNTVIIKATAYEYYININPNIKSAKIVCHVFIDKHCKLPSSVGQYNLILSLDKKGYIVSGNQGILFILPRHKSKLKLPTWF